MELAAANVLMENLMEKGLAPDAAAGFSLGEVTAAVVSGAFDNETGFRLVCKRGELMQKEAEKFDTFMAAVVKAHARTGSGSVRKIFRCLSCKLQLPRTDHSIRPCLSDEGLHR